MPRRKMGARSMRLRAPSVHRTSVATVSSESDAAIGYGSSMYNNYWLSNSLSSFPALKKGTFLAGTATVAPVFGLRPSFIRLDLRRKLPNPRISVLSPFFNESLTQSKIVFTTISACRLVNVVTCSETRSIICALVMSDSPFAAASAPARPSTELKRHEILEADARIEIQFGDE